VARTRRGLQEARAGCSGAGAGASPPASAGRRSASGARGTSGTTPWASAWPQSRPPSRARDASETRSASPAVDGFSCRFAIRASLDAIPTMALATARPRVRAWRRGLALRGRELAGPVVPDVAPGEPVADHLQIDEAVPEVDAADRAVVAVNSHSDASMGTRCRANKRHRQGNSTDFPKHHQRTDK
jgi:hypothetical protein